jgi:hypothetical protein
MAKLLARSEATSKKVGTDATFWRQMFCRPIYQSHCRNLFSASRKQIRRVENGRNASQYKMQTMHVQIRYQGIFWENL